MINIDETGLHYTFTGGYTMEVIGSGGPLCMHVPVYVRGLYTSSY